MANKAQVLIEKYEWDDPSEPGVLYIGYDEQVFEGCIIELKEAIVSGDHEFEEGIGGEIVRINTGRNLALVRFLDDQDLAAILTTDDLYRYARHVQYPIHPLADPMDESYILTGQEDWGHDDDDFAASKDSGDA